MKNIVKILIGLILLSFSVEMVGQPILPYTKFTYIQKYQPPLNIPPDLKGKRSNTALNRTLPKIDLNKKINDLNAKLDSLIMRSKIYTGNENPYTLNFTFYTYQAFLTDTVKPRTYEAPKSVFSKTAEVTPAINYKRMKTTGYIMVTTGVACQVTGALIIASYYNSQKITNDVKITKTNLYMKNSITHNMKKSTAIAISSVLGITGAVCEIWGGIKIGNARIGLNGITIPIK